ncbi:MAG: hypothetical protein ACRDTG_26150 [Pseudonocardiaceae bacterium]
MTEQGYDDYDDELNRSAPPPRPSISTGATPSQLAALPRPRVIDVSYWLWLGACLVGVITVAVTLIYFGELQADMLSLVEQQFPDESAGNRDQVATTAVAVLIGTGVLIVLIQMALAIVLHSGRGWARFALVVVGLLGTLYGIAVVGATPVVTKAGLLATVVLMVIAMVLMFLPGARAWFRQRRLAQSANYDHSDW